MKIVTIVVAGFLALTAPLVIAGAVAADSDPQCKQLMSVDATLLSQAGQAERNKCVLAQKAKELVKQEAAAKAEAAAEQRCVTVKELHDGGATISAEVLRECGIASPELVCVSGTDSVDGLVCTYEQENFVNLSRDNPLTKKFAAAIRARNTEYMVGNPGSERKGENGPKGLLHIPGQGTVTAHLKHFCEVGGRKYRTFSAIIGGQILPFAAKLHESAFGENLFTRAFELAKPSSQDREVLRASFSCNALEKSLNLDS
jgi:hypothetical protein